MKLYLIYSTLMSSFLSLKLPSIPQPLCLQTKSGFNTFQREYCEPGKPCSPKAEISLSPEPQCLKFVNGRSKTDAQVFLGYLFCFGFSSCLLLNGKSVLRLHRKHTCFVANGHLERGRAWAGSELGRVCQVVPCSQSFQSLQEYVRTNIFFCFPHL